MSFFVINDDKIVRELEVKGVEAKTKMKDGKLIGELIASKDSEINLCFYLQHKEVIQDINLKIKVKKGVKLKVIANCVLLNGTHNSNFKIEVEEGGSIELEERHYHSEKNVRVNAQTCLNLSDESNGRFSFEMRSGNGGRINYMFCSNLKSNSKLYSIFKGPFKANDNIKIDENVRLIGKNSSAIVKTKTVGMENSEVSFRGKLIGEGKNSKGHLECSEVVMDNAIARANPELEVIDETSRLTHEAAIGKIEEEKIKLLMAKGLSKERAIHLIIRGILND